MNIEFLFLIYFCFIVKFIDNYKENVMAVGSDEKYIRDIGDNLREIRKRRNLTIKQLSEKSEVSGITISNIENHKSNPTIGVLLNLADTLEVPLRAILHAKPTISTVFKVGKGYFANEISKDWQAQLVFGQDNTEVYRIKMAPNSSYSMAAQCKGYIEVITVMNGELKIKLEEGNYTLSKFESIHFDANQTHTYENPLDEIVFLNIVVKHPNV